MLLGFKLLRRIVHRMPQSSLLWLVDQIISQDAPGDDLPLRLADAANPHVDPALGVLEVNRLSLHSLGHLRGLYDNPSLTFNPEWSIPPFPHIHLHEDIIQRIPNRKWSLILPARLYAPGATYWKVHKAIKPKYPHYILEHVVLTTAYLLELYNKGILYKRHSDHVLSFCGEPYSWERKIILNNYTTNGGSTIGPCSGRSEHSTSNGKEQDSSLRSKNRHSKHPTGKATGRASQTTSTKFATAHSSTSSTKTTSHRHSSFGNRCSSGTGADTPNQRQEENSSLPRHHGAYGSSDGSDPNVTATDDRVFLRVGARVPARITGGIFLVDKNPRNNREARLVVDFSQFSRVPHRVRWPRFASPNLTTLANKLPTGLSWVSLDVSAAFYHIPMHPGSVRHTLIGIPGLDRHALLLLLQRVRLHQLYVFWEQREVLLCMQGLCQLRPVFLGFRKAPMGIGLSPFLLAQFTGIIVQHLRSLFQGVCCFAYMDDVVVGHHSDFHLASVVHAIHHLLLSLGIHINPEKTKWSGTQLFFLGYKITHSGIFPSDDKVEKLGGLLAKLQSAVPYDNKILQRLTGHLAFFAPFTMTGYALLQPLYQAIQKGQGWQMSAAYIKLLQHFFSKLVPVRAHVVGFPQVFSDATPSTVAFVDYWTHEVHAMPLKTLPIHVTELIAAIWAVQRTGCHILGVDNTIVVSKKMTKYPWLLACIANMVLREVSMLYVPSKLNPADLPSRGLQMLSAYPHIHPYRVQDKSHISLHVPRVYQPAKSNRVVSFR
ncbi:polymerase [Bluegill hepatitis B virus]|uniref:Protein P n=1 Tax=Bluegill hepatitis B virus TaxID=2169918 RepID=A0A193AUB1_9HEPA|nr:polymerase [Bluegill hepatitis B virus]ANN02848.1 polymerase [Bluegill hepatitis B virus]